MISTAITKINTNIIDSNYEKKRNKIRSDRAELSDRRR